MIARAAPVEVAATRSVETRKKLIEAALMTFARHGFDGASTRMIAQRARTNLAAIPYHFGGKQGLYLAVAQSIVEESRKTVGPAIAAVEAASRDRRISRRRAIELLHDLLDRFAVLIVGSPTAEASTGFVLREQLHPGPAFEILYEGLMRGITHATATLLASLSSARIDDPRVAVRTIAMLGEVLVFRTGGAAALRLAGWKSYSQAHVKLIQSVVRQNVDRIVGSVE